MNFDLYRYTNQMNLFLEKMCIWYSCYDLNVWLNVMQKLLIFLVVCDSALMR